MNHPQLNGHGDPGNWASVTEANNIEYPAIEAANGILPSVFQDCIMVADGCNEYQRVTLQSGPDAGKVIDDPNTPPVVIPVETALANVECNASKMAFIGHFSGPGTAKPDVLLGPAYTALVAAMASGDLNQVRAWWDAHFTGTDAEFYDFLQPLNLTQIVQQAQANVIEAAAAKLPKI